MMKQSEADWCNISRHHSDTNPRCRTLEADQGHVGVASTLTSHACWCLQMSALNLLKVYCSWSRAQKALTHRLWRAQCQQTRSVPNSNAHVPVSWFNPLSRATSISHFYLIARIDCWFKQNIADCVITFSVFICIFVTSWISSWGQWSTCILKSNNLFSCAHVFPSEMKSLGGPIGWLLPHF